MAALSGMKSESRRQASTPMPQLAAFGSIIAVLWGHRFMRPARWACAMFACMVMISPVQAAVQAIDGAASIRLPASACPAALRSPSFSIYIWVHPTNQPEVVSGILQIPGVVAITVRPDGGVGGVLQSSLVVGSEFHLSTTPGSIVPGRWSLIVLSYASASGAATLMVHTDGHEPHVDQEVAPAFVGKVLGPPTGDVALGAHPDGHAAFVGLYGLVAARTHSSHEIDAAMVFASRRYLSPLELDTTAAGGMLNGEPGCGWMLNHAMSALPINYGTAGSQFQRAAVVGQPVGPYNVHMYAPPYLGNLVNGFRTVYPTTAVQGFTYRSHRDPPFDGFFQTSVPAINVPPTVVPGVAPRARQLMTGPRGVVRVMTSANSRAVKSFDGSGFSPGNYAHGFIERFRGQTSGVVLRPLLLSSGGNPWFGLDAKLKPQQSATGTIESLSPSGSPVGDFSRFFTGSGSATGFAPGAGLFMRPSAYYSLRCRPEEGSLLLATTPLRIETVVLAFPGSASVTWRPDRASSQSAVGVSGDATTLALDTTRGSRTLGVADLVVDGREIVFAGMMEGQIHVGDACFVESGPGVGSISVVGEVLIGSDSTRVRFEHPFGVQPGMGSTLRFGVWEFRLLSHEWAGLDAADLQNWRGMRLESEQDGAGVVAFAMNAYRPDLDGFVWGAAGWTAHGYTPQLDASFERAAREWMRLSGAQIWLQMPAQQDSEPSAMSDYLARIRDALPQADVVWLGESSHVQHQTTSPWDRYIIDHASLEGVVGVSTLTDPRNGTHREQFADGQRGDNSHYTQRGNRRLADIWVEAIDQGAIDPCPADINYDGSLDVLDLLEFLDAFGSRRAWSDMNMDGEIDVLDFLEFIDGFSSGCA